MKNGTESSLNKHKVVNLLLAFSLILLFTVVAVIEISEYESKKSSKTPKVESVESNNSIKEESTLVNEYELENGNFECGIDFEEGKYDVVAVEGKGTVMCTMVVNQCLAEENKIDKEKGVYKYSTFKNATFKKGDVLKISRLKIKLIRK